MKLFVLNLLFAIATLACDDCYGPQGSATHVRNVRRMQPDAQGEWGQLNFLQTTDTHGWLEGFVICFLIISDVLTFEIGISRAELWGRLG